ncbi:MAG: dihydrodipicolinate synthase family protein, partial [Planctomycetes bacterium]|nr:dihydrodipicolinate synthase family protein [Planctomycetota bacterium]
AGDDLALFAGLDDLVVEAVALGARGWVAGLVNAIPRESVRLFETARRGDVVHTRELYEWLLPLLRLDTVPEFVQLIKLVQTECGVGNERVRAPRRPVTGKLREATLETIRTARAHPPATLDDGVRTA